jgi:serine palmitoyltransferase
MEEQFSFSNMMSTDWWINYLTSEFEKNPQHIIMEILCVVVILWFAFKHDYNPIEEDELTEKEEQIIIDAWTPAALCPSDGKSMRQAPVVRSISSRSVTIDDKQVLNFASHNYLALAERKEVLASARAAIDKYGVGSCGPRGFYGSFDVHINLEKKIADFYEVEEAILYSDGIACVSSVIPAFAKKGDVILCDESVHYGIQQGLTLCKAKVSYFRHNDMDQLEDLMKQTIKRDRGRKVTTRRFVIVEGVYQNVGDICPLPKIVQLKNQYKFRIIMDDSFGIGVLGSTGRGTCQHFGVQPVKDVEVIVATLDTAVASVGGFCVGEHAVIDHQRLSGAGYVFSASSPPYTSTASMTSLGIIMSEGKTLKSKLAENIRLLRQGLDKLDGVNVVSAVECPIFHMTLGSAFAAHDMKQTLSNIVDQMLEQNVAIRYPKFIPAEKNPPQPGLCFEVNVAHTAQDIQTALRVFKTVLETALRN